MTDFDNKENLGQKDIICHLNRDFFVHKIDLLDENSIREIVENVITLEGRIDALGKWDVLMWAWLLKRY